MVSCASTMRSDPYELNDPPGMASATALSLDPGLPRQTDPVASRPANEPATHDRGLFQQDWVVGLAFVLLDAALWLAMYGTFVLLRNGLTPGVDAPMTGFNVYVFALQLAALLLCLFIVGGYDRRTNFLSLAYMSEHLISLMAASVLGALLIYVGAAYGESIRPSRAVLISSLLAFAPLSVVYRRIMCQSRNAHQARSFFMVIGGGELARGFYRSYRAAVNQQQQLHFVEPADENSADTNGASEKNGETRRIDPQDPAAPIIETGTLAQLAAQSLESSGVIVAEEPRQLPPALLNWLTHLHFEKVPVYTLETFYERHWRRVPVHAIDSAWPFQASAHLAGESAYAHAKRLVDIIVAGAALLVFGPLITLLWWMVRRETGKPGFFRQQRVGRHQRVFTLYKLRTMHGRAVGAEGDLYTQANDPRVTPLGARLRKLRLDELPQLWNVLKGDMSLIGPRAEWDQLVERYEKDIPYYHFRHLVKPGITGWAQVNYPYGASVADAVQKLKYDLYYIRRYSLRLDAMIVLKTLHVMLWGKGQ